MENCALQGEAPSYPTHSFLPGLGRGFGQETLRQPCTLALHLPQKMFPLSVAAGCGVQQWLHCRKGWKFFSVAGNKEMKGRGRDSGDDLGREIAERRKGKGEQGGACVSRHLEYEGGASR